MRTRRRAGALKLDRRTAVRLLIGIAILICGLVAPAAAQQPATVPVGTIVAARKPIAKTADFVGRVQAIDRVEVHARITGYLEKILFKEGDLVKEGQPLYQIEKDLFQAAVDQAKGALAASDSKKLLTAIQYERAEQLVKTNTGTVVARDQALTADRAAAAQVMIDKANLNTSQINLGYTGIVSPINGKIGRSKHHQGKCRHSAKRHLDDDRQPRPDVCAVSGKPARVHARSGERDRAADVAGIKSRLRFADGSTYDQVGQIDFVDVTVDRATDTRAGSRGVPESRQARSSTVSW